MGKIIVIEGTDSSGKETQTKLLYERVKKIYDKTIKISFPNYDSPACEPVKMYLAGAFGTDATKVNPYPISTMYAIDRYASFKQDWEKKYIDDYIIITDRYVTSNMIHQASKIEDINFILDMPTLTDIEICSCKKIDNLIATLAQKNNLEKLTLWNQGNLDSIIPLSKLEHLTTLNIWEQTKIIDGKISFLEEMPNLKKIDIRKYTHYH